MNKEKSLGAKQGSQPCLESRDCLAVIFSIPAVIARINVVEVFVERRAHRSSNMRGKNWFCLAFLINY